MGSEFTNEAIELARQGQYLENVHCHLNLSACRSTGKHFVPLTEAYKKSIFCKDGEFARYKYYKADYKKYADVVFQELEAQYPDTTERKGRVEEHYRGTYWYYYEYE